MKKKLGELRKFELQRDALKFVVGGLVPPPGDIYCNINGQQRRCTGGTLEQCAVACADRFGTGCGGCGQQMAD